MDDMLSDLVEDRDKVRTEEEEEQVLSVFFPYFTVFTCAAFTRGLTAYIMSYDANGKYEAEKNTAENLSCLESYWGFLFSFPLLQ